MMNQYELNMYANNLYIAHGFINGVSINPVTDLNISKIYSKQLINYHIMFHIIKKLTINFIDVITNIINKWNDPIIN